MLIDLVFAVLIVIALIKGYQKGLILAVFSILAFIIGLAAAIKLSAIAASYLKDSIDVSAKWLPFLAFILVFIIVVILVRLGGKLVEKAFQVVLPGWFNRVGGVIFYSILYTMIFSIFLFYAEKLQVLQPPVIQSSETYAYLQPWGPEIINGLGKVIPVFKDMFTGLGDFFNGLSNKIQH